MRFIPALILITVLMFLPSTLYTRHVLLQKHVITAGIVAAYALPTLFLLALTFMMQATRTGIVDFRVTIWMLIILIAYILPTCIYSLFHITSQIVNHFSHRDIQSIRYIGLSLAIIVTVGITYGIVMRHNIRVRRITISTPSLPAQFEGTRIAHITDLHLGNLTPRDRYMHKVISKLQAERPDLLLFTGDMMNLNASEIEGLEGIFNAIDAPLGRYAVMGNHDYGDYCKWPSLDDKHANLLATHEAYRSLGFTLLLDSAIHITPNPMHAEDISSNATIGLIGVENWSNPPFPRYGDLNIATASFTPAPFNILLSHDPSHWADEVLSSTYHYIDLTLSGHTHSSQLGINIGERYKWSPSQFLFPHWDGHYQQGDQHLFVSRGLGYTAIPFRLGMPPEITIITLTQK